MSYLKKQITEAAAASNYEEQWGDEHYEEEHQEEWHEEDDVGNEHGNEENLHENYEENQQEENWDEHDEQAGEYEDPDTNMNDEEAEPYGDFDDDDGGHVENELELRDGNTPSNGRSGRDRSRSRSIADTRKQLVNDGDGFTKNSIYIEDNFDHDVHDDHLLARGELVLNDKSRAPSSAEEDMPSGDPPRDEPIFERESSEERQSRRPSRSRRPARHLNSNPSNPETQKDQQKASDDGIISY